MEIIKAKHLPAYKHTSIEQNNIMLYMLYYVSKTYVSGLGMIDLWLRALYALP